MVRSRNHYSFGVHGSMHRFFQALLLLLVLLLPTASFGQGSITELPAPTEEGTVAPTPCGTQPITIARMQWPSASLLAEIHARILRANFGCEVQVIPGDLAATASSMGATSQPAVAPEMWIERIADIWNPAVAARKVRQGGASFADTSYEGWFIPDYVATAHPEITSAASLREAAASLAAEGAKPRFISCPIDWGCSVINRNMLRANGLEALFDIVEPANRFELDSLIGSAVSAQEPIVFYYWQPNPVLAQFPFKPLDLGAYDKDAFVCLARRICSDPKPTAFAPERVIIAVADWVFVDAPTIASYFTRAQMPIGEMNTMLLWLNESGATVESVADRFVAERGDIWRPWLGTTP
jgi:glycine betaine/proline transport system substrate-binding protein